MLMRRLTQYERTDAIIGNGKRVAPAHGAVTASDC
ncbi:MAG: hypothetical protein RL261_2272 [Pseudomonadota bacterium]